MSYYEDEPRSHFGLYVALGVITFCLLGYFGLSSLLDSSSKQSAQPERSNQTPPKNEAPPETLTLPVDDLPEPTEEETLIDTGLQIDALKPETLLKQIGDSLKHGDFEAALTLIGEDNIAPEHLQRLKKLHSENRLQLDSESPVIEIGELDRNRRTRFALNLGNDQPPIYLDLARDPSNGKWSVEKAKLPPEQTITPTPSILTDSLGIGHAFLKASLAQQFDLAKSYVDSSQVSDAKIAGLCIIFEEANYHLRPKKPLRAMFNRETVAAFKAHVQAADGQSAAEFGINVQRTNAETPWLVTEINLDSLLSDYAQRIAGGDVHFTPLAKNPSGGDTLILYFGFDEDDLTPRTTRQLDIVASLLRLDPNKKLTLSGHTDALGSDDYNTKLSGRRAAAVEKYLLSVGVPTTQINKVAEGETKPRLPNVTQSGEDNPTGRRANRRTEIYLDF